MQIRRMSRLVGRLAVEGLTARCATGSSRLGVVRVVSHVQLSQVRWFAPWSCKSPALVLQCSVKDCYHCSFAVSVFRTGWQRKWDETSSLSVAMLAQVGWR